MSIRRYVLDLAFQEPIDTQVNGLLTAMEATIHDARSHAVVINPGQPFEEIATKAFWRICHHDEGDNHPPCEPEQEI